MLADMIRFRVPDGLFLPQTLELIDRILTANRKRGQSGAVVRNRLGDEVSTTCVSGWVNDPTRLLSV